MMDSMVGGRVRVESGKCRSSIHLYLSDVVLLDLLHLKGRGVKLFASPSACLSVPRTVWKMGNGKW